MLMLCPILRSGPGRECPHSRVTYVLAVGSAHTFRGREVPITELKQGHVPEQDRALLAVRGPGKAHLGG